MKKLYCKLYSLVANQRGDFIQNAIYIALVVIFGIGVMTALGTEIEGNFQSIIDRFVATRPTN